MRYVALIIVLACAAQGDAQPREDWTAYERTLREHGLATSGAGLLTTLRERTPSREKIASLAEQVKRLAAPKYAERTKAAAALVKEGQAAKPFLLQLINDPQADAEAARRAELCLRRIEDGNDVTIAIATAQLIGRDKPDGAAQVLLQYVPFVTEPDALEAVQSALNAMASKAGKPEPAFMAALKDSAPPVRAAAAEALVRGGRLTSKALVEPLLRDPSSHVRMQVALALAEAKEKTAVPVLIDLLGDLRGDQKNQVEDFLQRLAGEQAPALAHKAPPGEVQRAWRAWWQNNEAGLDLGRLQHPQPLGTTLVTLLMPGPQLNGRVMELNSSREVIWSIDGLRYPLDAQVLGKDRVLIAEHLANRVTERDFKGAVLWEKAFPTPLSCQRASNGETFIAGRRSLLIVDQDGKDLFTYFPQNGTIVAAQRARNGQITVVDVKGLLRVLDRHGRELRSFPVGLMNMLGTNIEVLPKGRVLVPLFKEHRVAEYDSGGRIVWQVPVSSPLTVSRLPSGNTLVASSIQQRLVEIRRDGSEAWSMKLEGRSWCVRGR